MRSFKYYSFDMVDSKAPLLIKDRGETLSHEFEAASSLRYGAHVLVIQATATSTTFGWESGLEQLGNQVTVLTRTPRLQFGGRPGASVALLPDSRWSLALAKRFSVFRNRLGAFPSLRAALRTVRALKADLAIVRVDRGRNIVIAVALTMLKIPWALWQEKTPPLARRWVLALRVGLRPVAAFTALDSRPGGVALSEPGSSMPRVSYTPFFVTANRPATPDPDAARSAPVRMLVVASFKNFRAKQQWAVLEGAARGGILDGSATFLFCGQGNETHEGHRRVSRLANSLGVEGLVQLRSNVHFEAMAEVYAEHDVLVLPSIQEGFGMAVIEAMAHGLPTVVSDAVGAIGCVVDGQNGLVFPSGDWDRLGEALRRIVRDGELRGSLSRGARAFVQDHLDSRSAATRIRAFF